MSLWSEVSRDDTYSIFFTFSRYIIFHYDVLVIEQVPLVEQARPTLTEYLSSSQIFCEVHVGQSLVFCVVFCQSLFVILSYFFWWLYCLSNYLRLLISDYPFNICKLIDYSWLRLPPKSAPPARYLSTLYKDIDLNCLQK